MLNYPVLSGILNEDSAVERGLNLTREQNGEMVKENRVVFP